MKACEEPFTLITPHICSNIRKAEAKARKGDWFFLFSCFKLVTRTRTTETRQRAIDSCN